MVLPEVRCTVNVECHAQSGQWLDPSEISLEPYSVHLTGLLSECGGGGEEWCTLYHVHAGIHCITHTHLSETAPAQSADY